MLKKQDVKRRGLNEKKDKDGTYKGDLG